MSADSTRIDFNALVDAIKRCLKDKQSIKSTAKTYGLSRTTLIRYLKKVVANFDDLSSVEDSVLLKFVRDCGQRTPSNMVFTLAQERDLVEYILKCVHHYYGLSICELRELAYQFASKLQLQYPSVWDQELRAGRHWYYNFIRRHPQLVLRTPEQTSLNRVKAFCKENTDIFFGLLGQLLDKHHFPATHIYNMDESGFSTVPTKIGKVIALKGMRRVGKAEAAERGTMVTMALTVSATGNSVPPFFLFPKKKMMSYFLDNTSDGVVGYANDSGWMAQPDFVRYMHHFIRFVNPSDDSPVLLLLDNHDSHMSIEAIDLAVASGVYILSFPPHCSHKMQPLDVSVFGPVKTFYKSQCSAWQKNNANKVLEIRNIAGLVCKSLDLALTPKTIKSGFRAAGIVPFDPDIFCDADFVQADAQNAIEVATESNLDEEEQRRIIVNVGPDVGLEEDVMTSPEPSTSRASSAIEISKASLTSRLLLLDEIGPVRGSLPKKRSNRGRKPMQTSVLTSPESVVVLREKADKAAERKAKRASVFTEQNIPQKKRGRPAKKVSDSEDDEDTDFCLICLALLPKKLTAANSISCNVCDRPVHLTCVGMTANIFTCKHCISDSDL